VTASRCAFQRALIVRSSGRHEAFQPLELPVHGRPGASQRSRRSWNHRASALGQGPDGDGAHAEKAGRQDEALRERHRSLSPVAALDPPPVW
jgi:hypothetical protein